MLQAQTIAGDPFSLLGQIQLSHKIQRKWREFLSSAERDLLSYLVDNTIAWQRTTLRATLEQMVTGTYWLPKTGLSMSTIQRVMKDLVQRGLVWVHSTSKRAVNTYEINLSWEPVMAVHVAVPKRLQARTEGNVVKGVFGDFSHEPEPMVEIAQVNLTGSVGQKETPLKENALKGKLEENTSYSQPVSQETDASEVKQVANYTQPSLPLLPRIRTRPVAVVPPVPVAPKPLPKTIRSVTNDIAWRKAWEAGFPGAPRKLLLPMERGMLAKARIRIEAMNINWFEFFEWSVQNWRHVMADKFGWMTKKPAPQYPDAQFLCTLKFTNSFLEAFAARREQDSIKVLRGEAAEVARMKAAGMSETQIAFELGRTRTFQEQRANRDAGEAHIASQMRVLKTTEARLKRERDVVLAQAAKGHPAFSLARPAINHGDNPYENPDAVLPEFTTEFGAFE